MSGIDVVILIVIGIFCVKGLLRGLIIEVFTLIGLLVGYVVALREMGNLAVFLGKHIRLPELVANVVCFMLIFILILLVFRWVASLLRRFMKWTFIGWLDRGGGVLFGLLKGSLIASLLLLLFSAIPFSGEMKQERERSLLYEPVRSVAPSVFNFLRRAFPKTDDFYEEVKEGFSDQSKEFIEQMKAKQLESIQDEIKKHVEPQ